MSSGAGGGGSGVAGDVVLKAGATAQMTVTPTTFTVSPAGTDVLVLDATSVQVAKATTFSEAVTVSEISSPVGSSSAGSALSIASGAGDGDNNVGGDLTVSSGAGAGTGAA